MSRPKHRRCQVCKTVTSRYAGTQDAGAFVVRKWVADPTAGEVLTVNGSVVRCREHADMKETR